MAPPPRSVNARRAAAILNISMGTLLDLRKRGVVEAVHYDGMGYWYDEAAIERVHRDGWPRRLKHEAVPSNWMTLQDVMILFNMSADGVRMLIHKEIITRAMYGRNNRRYYDPEEIHRLHRDGWKGRQWRRVTNEQAWRFRQNEANRIRTQQYRARLPKPRPPFPDSWVTLKALAVRHGLPTSALYDRARWRGFPGMTKWRGNWWIDPQSPTSSDLLRSESANSPTPVSSSPTEDTEDAPSTPSRSSSRSTVTAGRVVA